MSDQKKSSVWFLGTSSFAVPHLEALLKDPTFSVDLVITQPDKPVGRKQELTPPPVKVTALQNHRKIWQPENINNDFSNLNSESRPDFLIVVAYGQILSTEILKFPRIAPINVHYSLLPRWRGAAPIQHAILAGDTVTGITIQQMVRKLDAGDILNQEEITIGPRETFTTLHDRLAQTGVPLLLRTLKNSLHPVPQSADGITICHKLTRADGLVDAEKMTAEEIDRKVRGLTPWPGVRLTNGLKLLETALEPSPDSAPLPCADETTLYLVTVQPDGKKAMSGGAWARGRGVKGGK